MKREIKGGGREKYNWFVVMWRALWISAVFFYFMTPVSVFSAVPNVLNLQGRLMGADGNLLGGSGADYCFKFSIYDDAIVELPDNKLWPDSDPSPMSVNVKEGIFNVGIGDQLGGGDFLNYDFQDSISVFINIEVAQKNGDTCLAGDGVEVYETLSPRQKIYSVPYSINSGSVDGFHASQQALGNEIPVLNSGSLILGGINPQINSVSSTNLYVQGSADSGNVLMNALSGFVGIGAGTPREKLHLTSGSFLQDGLMSARIAGGDSLVFPDGGAKQVFVSGNYAYIILNNTAGANILRVTDVTNPASPEIIGGMFLSLPGFPSSVFVAGRYAYMVFDNAAGTDSFRIVDVGNPVNPQIIGGGNLVLPANGQHIFVSGRYAYITFDNAAGTDSFRIVDVGNPVNPVVVGGSNLILPSAARQVYVVGHYVYLTFYNTVNVDAFRIIDAGDPTAPVVVGGAELALGYSAWGLFVSGRYAYITFDNAAGTDNFRAVDVSNPSAPVVAGGSSLNLPGFPKSIFVSGRYAYAVFFQGAGTDVLRVIDVTGIEAVSGNIHSLLAGSLQVTNDARIDNQLSLGGGMHIDGGGLFVLGGIGVVGNSSFMPINDSASAFRIQNAAGNEKLLTVDTSGNFVKIGDDGGAANPTTLLILDNKMDAGDPAGVDGSIYYNNNVKKFRCNENGTWKDCDIDNQIVVLLSDVGGVVLFNPSAGGVELPNNVTRTKIDLSRFRSFRGVFIASTASDFIKLRLQYSIDGSVWDNFGTDVAAVNQANGVSVGSLELLPLQAKADVFVRAMIAGNGILDPRIRRIDLQLFTN